MIAPPTVTPADWMASLSRKKRIIIVSSDGLVREVRSRQRHGVGAKPPLAVPLFSPHVETTIQPAALLHAIGRITTPLIPNLADLSATWALYRYIWAFSPRAYHLCLSRTAKGIDFHQKGVLSDEIGVGMAYWLMSEYFDTQGVVDVDVALRDPGFAARLGIPPVSRSGPALPDYIFALPNGEYAIVECKGTQSGRSNSIDQIRRGLEQVPSIAFTAGQAAQEFVIATLLSTDGVIVYVVDPPQDPPDEETRNSKRGKPRRRFSVRDKERFDKSIRRFQTAALLSFAGAEGRAAAIAGIELVEERIEIREEMRLRLEPPETRRVQEVESDFRGYSMTYSFRGYGGPRLSVFHGLAADVYERISQERFWVEADDEEFWRKPEYWNRLSRQAGEGRNNIGERKNNIVVLREGDRVYTFGRDGTSLQLSFV